MSNRISVGRVVLCGLAGFALAADELVLKEGSASGMIAGGAFVIAGPPWFLLHKINPTG